MEARRPTVGSTAPRALARIRRDRQARRQGV